MTTPSRIDEILHEMEQDPELAQALRDQLLYSILGQSRKSPCFPPRLPRTRA